MSERVSEKDWWEEAVFSKSLLPPRQRNIFWPRRNTPQRNVMGVMGYLVPIARSTLVATLVTIRILKRSAIS